MQASSLGHAIPRRRRGHGGGARGLARPVVQEPDVRGLRGCEARAPAAGAVRGVEAPGIPCPSSKYSGLFADSRRLGLSQRRYSRFAIVALTALRWISVSSVVVRAARLAIDAFIAAWRAFSAAIVDATPFWSSGMFGEF